MDTTREKSRTYEEIRDKYFYLVYKMQEQYGLAEEDLSDLVVRYCEYIQENLHSDSPWYHRLYSAVKHEAEKLRKDRRRGSAQEAVSLQGLEGTSEESAGANLDAVLDSLCNKELHDMFTQLFDTLTPEEKLILEMRFFQNRTLRECGLGINRSMECARQIEKRALQKLRHPSRASRLAPFLNFDSEDSNNSPSTDRSFFSYTTLGSATEPGVCDVCSHVALAFQPEGPVQFEVRMVATHQHVIQVSVSGALGYLRDEDLCVVDFERATRYQDSSVPRMIAARLSGQLPDEEGRLQWASGSVACNRWSVPKLSKPPLDYRVSVIPSSAILYEVLRAPEDWNKFVLRLSVADDQCYVQNGQLWAVSIKTATRYDDAYTPIWIAKNLACRNTELVTNGVHRRLESEFVFMAMEPPAIQTYSAN